MKNAVKIYRASTREEVENKTYEDGAIYFIEQEEAAIAYDLDGSFHKWISTPATWDGTFRLEEMPKETR